MRNGRTVQIIREIAAEFRFSPPNPTFLYPYFVGAEGEGDKSGDGGNGDGDSGAGDGGDGAGGNGDGGNGNGGDGGEGEGGDEGQETFDRAYVESLRKESAGYRKRAVAAEKKLSEEEKAKMDDLTRAQTERDEEKTRADQLEAQLSEMRLSQAVTLEATGANFYDPQDALSLIPRAEIRLDEDGSPNKQSVKAAVERLAKAKPHLVKGGDPGSGDGGAGRGGGGTVEEKQAEYEKKFQQQGAVPMPK